MEKRTGNFSGSAYSGPVRQHPAAMPFVQFFTDAGTEMPSESISAEVDDILAGDAVLYPPPCPGDGIWS